MIIDKPVSTITELNNSIKSLLESNEKMKFIYVKGEISNIKYQPNGHLYFSLKDEYSMISAMMFANYAKKLVFSPQDGDEVVVYASISVYAVRGTFSLNVYEMDAVGQGQQLIELEKLKKKLAAEGLFDSSKKRDINLYPKAVGIITAPNGAAIKDIVTNLKRRYPIADLYVFPSSVQGENASKELLNAVLSAQNYELDTLIIGRGGGASEDLSSFNDEALVRAVAASKIPVIAAVGHEIDMTLVDFAADKRASTPTGAAELASIDQREIMQTLIYAHERMENAINDEVAYINDSLIEYKQKLNLSLKNMINSHKIYLEGKQKQLAALNPKGVLKRGYSLTLDENNHVVNICNVKQGDIIKTILDQGEITSTIKEVK